MSIVLGDFNEVRCEQERMGTIFSKHGASSFNEFINRAEFFDIPMSGRKFTRMNKYGTKLSKIDRILVSHHFISKWPNAQVLALRRELSDHCPLVLKTHSYEFGPIPFIFYNSWLLNGDFPTILSLAWHNPTNTRTNIHPAIILKNKLQTLQKHLKAWRENTLSRNTTRTRELKLKLDLLDTKAESNQLVDQDLFDRISIKKELDDLDHGLDLTQKAKVKWTLDGDENSKFFHGILNNKLSKSRIHSISLNGSWVSDPPIIINHIWEFHKNKFSNTCSNRPSFNSSLFKRLSDLAISLLDSPFSCEEIKEAVWNCGGDKSSGPDGFTFKFIKHYWDSIRKDFIDMVKNCEIDAFIPRGCNSSFIALVPKIQDPLHTTDYRPISLIGCQYKVIAKVLANRLLQVVGSVVSEVQTTFIKGRQIVDGPLMVNEIIAWQKIRKDVSSF
ncbi:putative RNA-directed DNA polymerase [Tanacetum coccineum]